MAVSTVCNDGGQNRQGNRNGDNAGASPIAEKHQDERGGQAGGDQRLANDAADGGSNETRLVEQRRDLQVLRQDLLDDG